MKLKISKNAKKQIEKLEVNDILSVQQVQKILGICRASVYQLIEDQKITAFQIGRTYYISKQSVHRYIEESEFS